jgi:hypothetical protein
LSLASLGVLLLLSITYSFVNRDLGADGCDVPVMSPTYIRMVGFDAEHTHFASKYNLYLYREEGLDLYTEENIGVRIITFIFVGWEGVTFLEVSFYGI